MSERIPLRDGTLVYYQDFLGTEEAEGLFRKILSTTPWEQEQIRLYGRWVAQPRLTAWFGRGMTAASRYTEATNALPWSESLLEIKERIESLAEAKFNSALANYYRDGSDSVDWHADDESCLGANPVIASLSLGAARRFVLRRKDTKSEKVELMLTSGSLLIMAGALQHHWQHAVPKTKKAVGGRINLTFRWIT